MGAIQVNKKFEKGIRYNIHDCITCTYCVDVCPKAAITYGHGEAWKNKIINEASPLQKDNEVALSQKDNETLPSQKE